MPSSNETRSKRKKKRKRESIETRRKRYAEQNERRRRRYAEDPEYRDTQLARRRAHYQVHKDAINERYRRKRDPEKARGVALKSIYGISVEDYANLLARQFGVCAICLRQPAKRLCVDHCHATRKIRGLLCRACNAALGFLRDDENAVMAAAAYLRKTRTS
jgi:hypothetical protein